MRTKKVKKSKRVKSTKYLLQFLFFSLIVGGATVVSAGAGERKLYYFFGATDNANRHQWRTVEFNGINAEPVALTQIQNPGAGGAAIVRMHKLTSTSFDLRIEGGRATTNNGRGPNEKVGYFGLTPGKIIDRNGEVIGESGKLAVEQVVVHNWHTLTFSNKKGYRNPVVIMKINSVNDREPAHIRVSNASANSANFKIEEWSRFDGVHGKERISYVVVESGRHELKNGTALVAGSQKVAGYARRVEHVERFSKRPVVFTQVQSANGSAAVVTQVYGVTKRSFKLRLYSKGFSNYNVASLTKEKVGFIAVGK